MRILLKYTLKSIGEKKFRSFLIIFAIALAGALFLASSRLAVSIGDMYMNQITAAYGDVDISMYPSEDATSWFINMSNLSEIADQTEYIVPSISSSGEYKEAGGTRNYIGIAAYNFEDFMAINSLDILEGSIDDVTAPYPLILSKNGARQLGLNVGDTIRLKIEGATKTVTLVAIADAKGFYAYENGNVQGIMPFDIISKQLRSYGKPTQVSIKIKPTTDKYALMDQIRALYPKCEVYETIDMEELYDELSTITDPLMLLTCIIIFMSVFIIYSSFKVIMLEKLPAIGTFRSVGASKPVMNAVLMMEAAFYGIIGSICACLLGVACLYGLSALMMQMMTGESCEVAMNIPPITFVETFLLASIMALVSTIIPILSVSKISLKDIILNNRPHKSRKYLKSTIIGCVLIAISYFLPGLVPKNVEMVASIVALLMTATGIVFALPLFVLVLSQGLGFIFKVIFGNIGELASKNIKKNKSVLNSITLITIGISVLLMISTMTQNMSDQVVDFYKNTFHCDILGYMGELDDQKVRMLKRIDGVERVIASSYHYIRVKELDDSYVSFMGIRDTMLNPDINFNLENEKEMLTKLQDGRYVILGKALKKRYDLKEGDTITITFNKQKDRQYTIIGFMDTLWNNGSLGLIPYRYYKSDSKNRYYEDFYITVSDKSQIDRVAEEIQAAADKIYTWSYVKSVEQQTIDNRESNNSLMSFISIFALLAMLIGIIGVVNNLIISFIERRQNIAMLRSIGMSKGQVLKMIFIEGLGSGLIGAMGGIIGGSIFCVISNFIMEAMQAPIKVIVEPKLFIQFLIGGMLITVLGSIIPARGSAKVNIIEAIKFE